MIIDNQTVLSDAQALTATAVSTNTYDTSLTNSLIGDGESLGIGFYVDVAADTASANETYAFAVISSAAANLGTPTTHESRTIAGSALTAGSKHFISLPPGQTFLRYIGANYTLGGTTPSVTVTAMIMSEADFISWKAYPNNISIS